MMRPAPTRATGFVALFVFSLSAACGLEDLDLDPTLTNIPGRAGILSDALAYCDDARWQNPLPHDELRTCHDEPVACDPLHTTETVGDVLLKSSCRPFLAKPVNDLLSSPLKTCRPAKLCAPTASWLGPDAGKKLLLTISPDLVQSPHFALYPGRTPIAQAGWSGRLFEALDQDTVPFKGKYCKPKFIVIHVAQTPQKSDGSFVRSCEGVVRTFEQSVRSSGQRFAQFCVEPGRTFQLSLPTAKGGHLPDGFDECHYVGVEHAVNEHDPELASYYVQSARLVGWLCYKYGFGKCDKSVVFGHRNAHPIMTGDKTYDEAETSQGPMRPNATNPVECPFTWDFGSYYPLVAKEYDKWTSGFYADAGTVVAQND